MKKCEKCGYNHEETETCEQVTKRVEGLLKTIELTKSGYGGILPNGNIVDRREHKDAIPFQENPLFGTPKPKPLPPPPSKG